MIYINTFCAVKQEKIIGKWNFCSLEIIYENLIFKTNFFINLWYISLANCHRIIIYKGYDIQINVVKFIASINDHEIIAEDIKYFHLTFIRLVMIHAFIKGIEIDF